MENCVLISLLSVFYFISSAHSCMFRFVTDDQSRIQRTSTDKTKYTRKIYNSSSNGKFSCGQEIDFDMKPWNVFVKVNSSETGTTRFCFGTIIAHNLVVTSHKCLYLKGKKLRPYEAWIGLPKEHREANVASAKDVTVQTYTSDTLSVLNITLNLRYSEHGAAENAASSSDVAVIVTDGDLFKLRCVEMYPCRPVCLPLKNEDIIHSFGYYYGPGGQSKNDTTPETRMANRLVIKTGKDCDDEGNFGDISTKGSICIRSVAPLPTIEGGPLLTTNVSGYLIPPEGGDNEGDGSLVPHTTFLIGISTLALNKPSGMQNSYTYFANVIENLDFIEKVAEEHKSLWCETPPFVETKKAPSNLRSLESWPWESGYIKWRSETLDCACGLKNSKATGRNVGRRNAAIPHEFGWMVRLTVSWDPEDRDMKNSVSKCGASIINDRVILTAAHCLVQPMVTKQMGGISYEHFKAHKLYIGLYKLNEKEDKNKKMIKAKDFIIHPAYTLGLIDRVFAYDIALLILEKPLKFSTATTQDQVKRKDIRPVCLPKVKEEIELKNGTELIATGYGYLNPGGKGVPVFPEVLQKRKLPVRDLKYCTDQTWGVVPDTVFCVANFSRHGVAPDVFGGPLITKQPSGQYFQVGIINSPVDMDLIAPDSGIEEQPSPQNEWLDFLGDVQQFIPFIDYYSGMHDAKWCKT